MPKGEHLIIKRKTRVRKHVIADMSFHHLAFIMVSCGFTVQRVEGDYGYDLTSYTFDKGGQFETGNIYVQLKATDSLEVDKDTGEIKHRINKRDIGTWEDEPFPVYYVVFDAKNCKAYSIHVQQYLKEVGISSETMKNDTVGIRLPNTAVDIKSVQGWRDTKNAILDEMRAKHVKKSDL